MCISFDITPGQTTDEHTACRAYSMHGDGEEGGTNVQMDQNWFVIFLNSPMEA